MLDALHNMSSHRSTTPMSAGEDTDDEDDPPPVQYEDPSPPEAYSSPAKPQTKGHHRVTSLVDTHGNPVTLPGSPTKDAAGRWSDPNARAASTASIAPSDFPEVPATPPVLGWEDVANLPYRTRKIAHDGRSETVDIVDRWNDANDPAFEPYWSEKKRKDDEAERASEGIRNITVTETEEEKVCEDDELDPDKKVEGMYIVCYHLPVTVSRDEKGQWSAVW